MIFGSNALRNEKCHSKMLRQLLRSYGKLVSISEMKGKFCIYILDLCLYSFILVSLNPLSGGIVAHIAFDDSNIKTRAEGFLSSITNSFEVVLQCNVEVKWICEDYGGGS
ncbi:hypothetical protein ACS0TY_035948 [Phlomoides rotata]